MYEDLAAPTAATANASDKRKAGGENGRHRGCIPQRKHGRVGSDRAHATEQDNDCQVSRIRDGRRIIRGTTRYGTLRLCKAAHLRYLTLREKLETYGFEVDPAQPCVFNKLNASAGV